MRNHRLRDDGFLEEKFWNRHGESEIRLCDPAKVPKVPNCFKQDLGANLHDFKFRQDS